MYDYEQIPAPRRTGRLRRGLSGRRSASAPIQPQRRKSEAKVGVKTKVRVRRKSEAKVGGRKSVGESRGRKSGAKVGVSGESRAKVGVSSFRRKSVSANMPLRG